MIHFGVISERWVKNLLDSDDYGKAVELITKKKVVKIYGWGQYK